MEDVSTSFASHQLRQTAEQLAPSAVEFNKQYWDEAYLPLKGSVRVPLRLIWVASVSTLVSHFMECFSGTKTLTQEAFMQSQSLKISIYYIAGLMLHPIVLETLKYLLVENYTPSANLQVGDTGLRNDMRYDTTFDLFWQ